ncbi:macoilin [Diorhabda sublineata]|uniref:macoilin n=1 Tax=Diorhabda sublineata TaxID=1163346 RepID=UPI0024E16221|nr:macoilin [Diorhabda sublineata]XP_056634274.1 macoilin [Diorhabda sublineata]
MKRRNAEIAKMRRPLKKNKITEGFYGSTLLYLKFVILWVLVILADFILEFRFEFLWPFYLLLRSVYDSFKYQGLAFSIFFVCIALTSDMLCYFFIPVHWLFFAASTYVWVQYVWHTDKGICAPTIILWVLFVYLEAAVRLRDIKHMPGHLDLCRPFAAHCIGYPVVTLGFGFKSYVGYRMRQRKQQVVAKENQFYMQLMQQALPIETCAVAPEQVEPVSNAVVPVQPVLNHSKIQNSRQSHEKNGHIPNGAIANGVHNTKSHHRKSVEKCKDQDQHGNDHNTKHSDRHIDRQKVNHAHTNGSVVNTSMEEGNGHETEMKPVRRREKKEQDKEREAAEYLQRLETDCKKLRSDLHLSRASEQDLRLQVASLTTSEKVSKGEISLLQREVEELQQRLQSAQSTKSSDKQTISNLERRLAEERRLRSSLESQLNQERKNRKQEEARAAQVAAQQSSRGECTESCKARRRELESEIADLRASKHWQEDRLQVLERESSALSEQIRDTDLLMSALSAMQEKNTHLENSLSAENRIKLDLFSALGEAKRQLEIRENANRAHEKEIEELKSKIAQVLAVMPTDTFGSPTSATNISRVRLAESPLSNLDPNATAYTPKNSLVASTEA